MAGKTVDAGKLRHRIAIQKPAEVRNDEGEPIASWVTIGNRWASINPISGRELWSAAQVQAQTTHRVILRFFPGLSEQMRFQYRTRIFNIQAVLVADEVENRQEVLCIEVSSRILFQIDVPAAASAGVGFAFTVTAQDQFNNTLTGYLGTVAFGGSDSAATWPTAATLSSGRGVFSATLRTPGDQTITAADTANSAINGSSNPIEVTAATHFIFVAPGAVGAGVAFAFTVVAKDQYNVVAPGYTGTVHFTASDTNASISLPANATLASGSGVFSATLRTAGNQTLTATDVSASSLTGSSNPILVTSPATHFSVASGTAATAGTGFRVTVTALDASNATALGYLGLVRFTSTDGQAVLPADSALVSGVGIFSVTLGTVGTQTLTAADTASPGINGHSAGITVAAGTASRYAFSNPSPIDHGNTYNFTLFATDAFSNPITSYGGTAHISSGPNTSFDPVGNLMINGFLYAQGNDVTLASGQAVFTIEVANVTGTLQLLADDGAEILSETPSSNVPVN